MEVRIPRLQQETNRSFKLVYAKGCAEGKRVKANQVVARLEPEDKQDEAASAISISTEEAGWIGPIAIKNKSIIHSTVDSNA